MAQTVSRLLLRQLVYYLSILLTRLLGDGNVIWHHFIKIIVKQFKSRAHDAR